MTRYCYYNTAIGEWKECDDSVTNIESAIIDAMVDLSEYDFTADFNTSVFDFTLELGERIPYDVFKDVDWSSIEDLIEHIDETLIEQVGDELYIDISRNDVSWNGNARKYNQMLEDIKQEVIEQLTDNYFAYTSVWTVGKETHVELVVTYHEDTEEVTWVKK